MNSEVSCRFDGFWKMAINSSLRDCSEANCASLSTRLVEGAILERNPLAVGSTNDTLSDAYTVQRTHTKTQNKTLVCACDLSRPKADECGGFRRLRLRQGAERAVAVGGDSGF